MALIDHVTSARPDVGKVRDFQSLLLGRGFFCFVFVFLKINHVINAPSWTIKILPVRLKAAG